MGMVLSAVGACLLFILKAVGILLLILLVLAALLLLCPFCADVCWQNDTLTVKAGALGITFPVFQYPKPEPPAQPEMMELPPITFTETAGMFSRLPQPSIRKEPVHMLSLIHI